MPPFVAPAWNIVGNVGWPIIIALALLLWFVGSVTGLMGIIAHGVQAVMNFGMNFLARTVALAALVGLVLFAVAVFTQVGAPSPASYFPANATAPRVGATPSGTPTTP